MDVNANIVVNVSEIENVNVTFLVVLLLYLPFRPIVAMVLISEHGQTWMASSDLWSAKCRIQQRTEHGQ